MANASKRRITIEIHESITDEGYHHLANAVWMPMRATPHDFTICPHARADLKKLNHAWEQYG